MAGLGRAFQGTLLMLLVVIVVAVPLGVAAAVYLEEFAPKNRFTDLIEITSTTWQLSHQSFLGFGLGVLVNMLFPFARGYPIIGGLVLSFMTLPTVIIASRAAILAVPSSYKKRLSAWVPAKCRPFSNMFCRLQSRHRIRRHHWHRPGSR